MGTFAIPMRNRLKRLSWGALLVSGVCGQAVLADSPGLGQPVNGKKLSSLIIWPDGSGLPRGTGTVRQGREVYQEHCVSCHGVEGRGGINDVLAGGQVGAREVPSVRTIGSYWPYATSLFDYVRRAMPYRTPGVLKDDEVYSVVAYLLYLNEIISESERLNARSLAGIKLPNRARFHSEFELP